MLLGTVAKVPHQGAQSPKARDSPEGGHSYVFQSERSLEVCTNPGYPDRYDPDFIGTHGSRASICQRTVGEHLSASGGFITRLRSGYLCEPPRALARLRRGPARGVVWGGGVKISPLPDYVFSFKPTPLSCMNCHSTWIVCLVRSISTAFARSIECTLPTIPGSSKSFS